MASSFVDIANSALIRMGASIISDLGDNTTEANACRVRIFPCRDFVLRMHPWNCATTRVILAPDLSPPAFGYAYQFTLPSDCLKALDVSDDPGGSDVVNGSRPDYKIEGRKILFQSNKLYFRYIQRVDDPSILEEGCVEAISAYLAYDLSQYLLQNEVTTANLYNQFKQTMAQARNLASQEEDISSVIDRFERVRRGW